MGSMGSWKALLRIPLKPPTSKDVLGRCLLPPMFGAETLEEDQPYQNPETSDQPYRELQKSWTSDRTPAHASDMEHRPDSHETVCAAVTKTVARLAEPLQHPEHPAMKLRTNLTYILRCASALLYLEAEALEASRDEEFEYKRTVAESERHKESNNRIKTLVELVLPQLRRHSLAPPKCLCTCSFARTSPGRVIKGRSKFIGAAEWSN